MLLRWTQHWQPRVVSKHVAQLVDLMPTLLHACGVEAPVGVQGRDLSDILDGKAEQVGDGASVIETSGGTLGIRTPTHLYGARLDTSLRNLTNDERQFFDLRSDPYEMTNLAMDNQRSALANALHEQLIDWNAHTPWMKG
jgi:arylsulfatase A-like enzyme